MFHNERRSSDSQLKTKVGVVKRYQKELALYRTEVVENQRKLKSVTATEGESWDVKNATNLVRESENMVCDTTTRLERAIGGLEDLLTSTKRNAELDQGLREAEAVLAAASNA
ncbi:tubulin binding cofactor A [Lactifluus subvellereus]|nr:tubulin binding cofactor A [Lactifluus subvellereus]